MTDVTCCLLCVFSGILINRAAGKDAATAGVMGSQSVYYEDYNRSKSEVRTKETDFMEVWLVVQPLIHRLVDDDR